MFWKSLNTIVFYMDIKVSIIIPVYNAERYISKCIESIIEQAFKDFEIILIDDGSTDGSGLICDGYANKYSNIQAIHQSNSGVSSARNLGIAQSKGTYLTFVDADDYVGPDFLYRLTQGPDFDFVYANSCIIGKDHPCIVEEEYKAEIFDKQSFETHFCKIPLAKLAPWNKLYRRSIVEQHHIRFNEKLHYGEDTLFVLEFLNHCKSILLCGLVPYYYDDTPGKYKNLSHDYLMYWLEKCILAYQNVITKWDSSFSASKTQSAVVSFQRNNYYMILKSLVDDKILSLSQKYDVIQDLRSHLLPKQDAKLNSKKEKLIELCFALPTAVLSYHIFKIVSIFKK